VLATFIGPPLRATFAGLLGTSEPARVEEAIALYRERFADVGLFENEVYPGVAAMLAGARETARALFVATSKPAVYAERIVAHFGIREVFDGVYGAELGGRFDDKAELIAHLLSREGVAPASAVMIGDRAADVAGARANGLRSVGVLWGYGSERELLDAGADALCPRTDDLGPVVAGLPG
jgi:phosphoglycolate phosphatase